MIQYLIIIILVAAVIALACVVVALFKTDTPPFESGERCAGRKGEEYAREVIRSVMREDDILLHNIAITYDGKKTELDSVVVNNRGVYIIEVKNYKGTIVGGEDEGDWFKMKQTAAGKLYSSTVRNPIKQVNRQVYILSGFMKQHGINVWLEGYAFLVHRNSPVKTSQILETPAEIDNTLHRGRDNHLTPEVRNRIVRILSGGKRM